MKIIHLGAVITASLITLGLLLIIPPYTRSVTNANSSIPVMLTFSVIPNEESDLDEVSIWCDQLSSMLERRDIKAVVFISGTVADSSPECVTSFPSGIDIGSQTYDYVNLTSVRDYTKALEEVKRGKETIDRVGNLETRVFKAPYGSTDDNIYSLLSRSGIVADFSYEDQYNKLENGQFIKYSLKTLHANSKELTIQGSTRIIPVAISFDSSMKIEDIDAAISDLISLNGNKIHFVNATQLTGIPLTIRGDKD